ncbi:MAG: hypothetical protein R2759_07525 [Bacteroidales bacterium]
MKAKSYSTLVFSILIAGFTLGQSLVLTYEGTILEPNEEVMAEGAVSGEIVVEMDVTNNSGGSIDVLCQRYEEDMVPGSQRLFAGAVYVILPMLVYLHQQQQLVLSAKPIG